MMGSSSRRKQRVVSFQSGLQQGIRGFGTGIWDGLTGMLVEPVDGFMRQVSDAGTVLSSSSVQRQNLNR